jgi:hypothetical protein
MNKGIKMSLDRPLGVDDTVGPDSFKPLSLNGIGEGSFGVKVLISVPIAHVQSSGDLTFMVDGNKRQLLPCSPNSAPFLQSRQALHNTPVSRFGRRTRDAGYGAQDTERRTRGAGHGAQDTGAKLRGTMRGRFLARRNDWHCSVLRVQGGGWRRWRQTPPFCFC